MTFLSKFFPTVDSIVADLQDTVERLDTLTTDELQNASVAQSKASWYTFRATEHKREAERAARIAKKVKDLIA